MQAIPVLAVGAALVAAIAALGIFASVGRVWIRATASGVPVPLFRLLGMKLRGHPPGLLVDAYILLVKQGAGVSLDDVEGVYLQNRNRVRYAEELAQLAKERKGRR